MRLAVIVGFALALAAMMSGCSDDSEPATRPMSPAPTGAPTAEPSAEPRPSEPVPTPPRGGSGGLTIRYLDTDGTIKTIHVQDFQH